MPALTLWVVKGSGRLPYHRACVRKSDFAFEEVIQTNKLHARDAGMTFPFGALRSFFAGEK